MPPYQKREQREMILQGLFGRHATSKPREIQKNSNVVDFIETTDRRVKKQLASCMRDIQQLMLRQKAELKQKTKVKVTLQLV